MNWDDYQAWTETTWGDQGLNELASRTATYGVSEADQAAIRSAGERLNWAVCGLGLAGEAAEVAEGFLPNVDTEGFDMQKELGDVLYYLARCAHFGGINLSVIAEDCASVDPVGDQPGLVHGASLASAAGIVADEIKKFVGHGHWKASFDLRTGLRDVFAELTLLALGSGLTMEQIAVANRKKLDKRYEGGFSTEKSIARVDLDETE